MVKNPPAHPESVGSIPGLGRFPHAEEQLSPSATTTEHRYHSTRSHCNEKPMHSKWGVICEHFSGTNIFLTNGIVPRIHIRILKAACEGTLISFHHLLIVQMGTRMFIEGE